MGGARGLSRLAQRLAVWGCGGRLVGRPSGKISPGQLLGDESSGATGCHKIFFVYEHFLSRFFLKTIDALDALTPRLNEFAVSVG